MTKPKRVSDDVDLARDFFGLSAPELAHEMNSWFEGIESMDISRAKFCEVVMVRLMALREGCRHEP